MAEYIKNKNESFSSGGSEEQKEILQEEGGSSDSDRERRIQQNLATINAIVEDTGAQGSMISTEELRGQSDNQRLQHDTIPHHASASGKIPQECAMAHPQHSDMR